MCSLNEAKGVKQTVLHSRAVEYLIKTPLLGIKNPLWNYQSGEYERLPK